MTPTATPLPAVQHICRGPLTARICPACRAEREAEEQRPAGPAWLRHSTSKDLTGGFDS